MHESLCVGAVLSGTRHIAINNQTFILKSGDVVLLSPGQAHACPDAGHSTYIMFCITAELLNRLGFDCNKLAFPSPRSDDPILFGRIMTLAESIEQAASSLEKDITLLNILEALPLTATSEENTAKQISQQIQLARHHLEKHCTETVRLEDLARKLNISPCRLNRRFTAEVGMPPHEYQSVWRIRRVKSLITTGSGLAEASASAGFSDQSHMTRCFKKIMGITPGKYIQGMHSV